MIAERGADATRFADVAAESGVPVSTLQYYFGSREDLLVAAFRHASSTEIAALETEVAGIDDPWHQLETILTRSLTGYEPEAPDAGRLWIESWHFGIRDPEMRADALRDNTAWRRLVAGVVQRGIERGLFTDRYDAEMVAVLAVAAADGMGIPLSLGDPDITAASAVGVLWPRYVNSSITKRSVSTGDIRGLRLTSRWRITLTKSLDGALTCSVS